MAIKEFKKTTKFNPLNLEKEAEIFIAKGGALPENFEEQDDDHSLTLRIPKSLMAKIDIKHKQRIGKISQNLWILENLRQSDKKM